MLFFTAQDLSLFPCPGRHPRVGRANRPFRNRGHRKLGHVFRKDPHCQRASPGRGPGLSLPGVGQKAGLIHGIFRQQVSSLAVNFLFKKHWFACRANQWTLCLMEECCSVFLFLPTSEFVQEPWRSLWSDTAPFKGPLPRFVCCFRNFSQKWTFEGHVCIFPRFFTPSPSWCKV